MDYLISGQPHVQATLTQHKILNIYFVLFVGLNSYVFIGLFCIIMILYCPAASFPRILYLLFVFLDSLNLFLTIHYYIYYVLLQEL